MSSRDGSEEHRLGSLIRGGARIHLKRRIGVVLRRWLPRTFYWIQFHRMLAGMPYRGRQKEQHFRELIASSAGRSCLQIGARGSKYAPHWIAVDLYDRSDHIDHPYDIHDLRFPDQTFDMVVCNAILEHVEDPIAAINQLRRVLKPGGYAWIEVPFLFPYHAAPEDYWRVSVPGLRRWMKEFQEIDAGYFRIAGSKIHIGVFYYGRR